MRPLRSSLRTRARSSTALATHQLTQGLGWREGSSRLELDSRKVGEGHFQKSAYARFLRLEVAHGASETQSYVCPVCLDYGLGKVSCRHGGKTVKTLPATCHESTNPETRRYRADCPACGADDALMLLGARAASLSSVAVSQIFHSLFHGDTGGETRKLLAFTDSVQDASHRAGFFAGRTFRFNLRTAIQTAVLARGGELPLEEAAAQIFTHFARALDEPKAIATFTPPDLREHPAYGAYREQLAAGNTPKGELRQGALELVHTRLGWEVTLEICVAARSKLLVSGYQKTLQEVGIATEILKKESDSADRSKVRLGTMHRVKGLEFRGMIIAGVQKGQVPQRIAHERFADEVARAAFLQGERHLLYVAATRARDELLVTGVGELSEFLCEGQQGAPDHVGQPVEHASARQPVRTIE